MGVLKGNSPDGRMWSLNNSGIINQQNRIILTVQIISQATHPQDILMNHKDFEHFVQNCEQLQTLPNNKTVVKVKETGQLFIFKKIIPNYSELDFSPTSQLEQTLKQQKHLYHENLLALVDYYCQTKNQQIIIITEYYSHSLKDEFEIRKSNKNQFLINELENIVISATKALKYLYERDIGHGCISLKDIVIDNNGSVKIVDPSIASNSPFLLNHEYFYSPELLLHNLFSVECSSNAQDLDFCKNDIFILGMNILQLGLPKYNILDCINFHEGIINYEDLEHYLNIFQKNYTVSLTVLLSKMLQEETSARITLQQILQYIEQEFFIDEDSSQFDDNLQTEPLQFSKNKTVNSFMLSNLGTSQSSVSSGQGSFFIENPFSVQPLKKSSKISLIQY